MGSTGCRKIAVYANTDLDCVLPLNSALMHSQWRALAVERPAEEVITSCGAARCDTEGLFRISQRVKQVL